jgi:hypothetical protein
MDVVPSSSNPSELFIYLVNHRIPLEGDPAKIGADSSIEVFKTTVGRSTMTHVRTFEDPNFIVTPNDVVGSADGKSVFATNDRGHKVGIVSSFVHAVAHVFLTVGRCVGWKFWVGQAPLSCTVTLAEAANLPLARCMETMALPKQGTTIHSTLQTHCMAESVSWNGKAIIHSS